MRPVTVALLLAFALQACAPDPHSSMEERWVGLPGSDSLHYAITGMGTDTIVVLAGGPGWSSSYLRQPLATLARNHGLVFIDLRGRGLSSPITDSLAVSLDTDLKDLAAAQSALKLGRVVLAGHGYGAGLAAMYALRHPDRVAELVLLSPMFTTVNLVWQGSFQPNDSLTTARYLVARRLGRDTLDPRGFCQEFWGFDLSPVEEADPAVVALLANEVCSATSANLKRMSLVNHAIRRSLGSWDWRDTLRMVSQPTLVVQGDGNLFLKRTGQIWSELLPHATFASLPGNSHFPWLDNSTMFTRVVDSFLSTPNVIASSQ